MTVTGLFVVIFSTAFIFALKPGALTLLAFQRVLTQSFFSGWIIGAGSTAGQAVQASGVVLLFILVGDLALVQSFGQSLKSAALTLAPYTGQLLIGAGAILAVWGWFNIQAGKKENPAKPRSRTGFVLGFVVSGMAIDYIIAYVGIIAGAIASGLEMSVIVGLSIVLAVIAGIQGAWLFKLGGIYLLKLGLGARKVNVYAFTGWTLICLGAGAATWGSTVL